MKYELNIPDTNEENNLISIEDKIDILNKIIEINDKSTILIKDIVESILDPTLISNPDIKTIEIYTNYEYDDEGYCFEDFKQIINDDWDNYSKFVDIQIQISKDLEHLSHLLPKNNLIIDSIECISKNLNKELNNTSNNQRKTIKSKK